MLFQQPLNFGGVNLEAAMVDRVAFAIDDVEVAVLGEIRMERDTEQPLFPRLARDTVGDIQEWLIEDDTIDTLTVGHFDVLAEEAVEARMQRFVRRAERYPVPHKGIYRVHQRVAREWRAGRILLAGDAAHLNNPLGAFGLNGGLHDAILLGEYLGKVCRGEAGEDLLDLYVRQRRTANVEFVQTQSIGNKRLLEEADPARRRESFDNLRRIASGRESAREFLVKSSMIWSVRRAAEVT